VKRASLGAVALALAFIALHLPFLPASLEDLDSINFALGIRDFDVARHQPHPPGYPIFILAAKAVHAVVPSEAHALSAIGIAAGGLAALALVPLFRTLEGARRAEGAGLLGAARGVPDVGRLAAARSAEGGPLMATLLTQTTPLFWMTAARPLSDAAGLAAALAVQALTVTARTRRGLIAAGACAGLGAGIRSQVAWLTVPLLLLGIARRPLQERRRDAAAVALASLAGVLVWAVPLVLLTGGPAGYVRVVFNQGAEDLSGVVMLWTTPTLRQLLSALESAFVAPWGLIPVAVVVLLFAAMGLADMARGARPALTTLAIAFGPYLVFDLLFQETVTTRYALPLVVPVAYLAVRGASKIPSSAVMPAFVALAGFNVFIDTSALLGYSRMEAPAFRLLADMQATASARRKPPLMPVLAMHRRDELDMRRPIVWVGDQMPITQRLPAPAKHEWLEVVKYWNEGGRAPVWFVADPPRSDLALIRRQRPPAQYRWPFAPIALVGGARPGEMDWHVIEPPDWYLGEGWAITPETAGLAREDGRGPGRGGIRGWIRRWPGQATMMIGGRNLADSGPAAHVRIAVDGQTVDQTTVAPGFFLRMLTLAPASVSGAGDYATVTVDAEPDTTSSGSHLPADVAVEQFDAQMTGRVVFGFGDGWHEQEYNPTTGRLWRWTSERAALRVRAGGHSLSLRMDGELEAAATSHVVVRAGDRIVADQDVGKTFSIAAAIPAEALGGAEGAITIETSHWYVPAERSRRSHDRRHLGLKIYNCQLAPVS
jgi:hypothetical protein